MLLLLGAALRVGMLAQQTTVRFHPDEALYATFARRISLHGDFLLQDAPLDKPPLALAVSAGSFTIFGPTEFAARLPTVFVSILTLAVTYALARGVYSEYSPEVPLVLLALSPLDLAFAATAFVDPLLTLCLVASFWLASRDRWRGAGIAFVLAAATKQSALPFVLLIVAVGMARNLRPCWRRADYRRRLVRFTVPVVIGALLLAAWSVARAAPVDFWALGVANNNPGRLIRADEVLPRLARWLDLLHDVTGAGPLLALVALVPFIGDTRRNTVISLLLATGLLAFLLAYWLVAFNTYDRYLHPLGPLLLILVGYVLAGLQHRLRITAHTLPLRHLAPFLTPLAVVAIMPFTITALRGQLDIGGDHGQNTGIDHLVAVLNTLPGGAIVYDYWLGWELGYYLGDQPHVNVIFLPSPQVLMQAVCANSPAYFVAPAGLAGPWLEPLQARNGSVSVLMDGPFNLYRLDCT